MARPSSKVNVKSNGSPEPSKAARRIESAKSKAYRIRQMTSKAEDIREHYPVQEWSLVKELLIANLKTSGNMSTPTNLAHGFQLIRTMHHANPIQYVLYVPQQLTHFSLDGSFLHMWKGGIRINKFPTTVPVGRTIQGSVSKHIGLPGIVGVIKIIFLEKKQLYVIATKQLQMKILDIQFEEVTSYSNPLPILRF